MPSNLALKILGMNEIRLFVAVISQWHGNKIRENSIYQARNPAIAQIFNGVGVRHDSSAVDVLGASGR